MAPVKSGTYRPDIDGLRTVAVVPVVLYHAGVAPFTGGYIGVDVFFVISGFLITSILKADLDNERYTLSGFYVRRARRILPALIFCTAITFIAGMFVLPPGEFGDLGRSIRSVAVFASNFYFWKQGDYFGPAAEEQPLLHTWSLAVEEQFYILWPLVLSLVLYRLARRRQLGVLLALMAASFALATWKIGAKSAFFLPQYRAWELGVGAVLGLGFVPQIRALTIRQALSALGLLLIVAPCFLYDSQTPFPGYMAAAPCVGAALLLHSNAAGDTYVARLLSWKPMVAVGLISYSLYLWHWPILVLSRIWFDRTLGPVETGLAIAVSVMMAWLSWRFVEAPFRRSPGPGRSNQKILIVAAAALVATACAGQAAVTTNGAAFRVSPQVMAAEQAAESINPNRGDCHVSEDAVKVAPEGGCTASPGRYQILLWGDSRADHFAVAVHDWANAHGVAARQATKSACRPLLTGAPAPALGITSECARFNATVLAEVKATPSIDTIILSGWWLPGDGTLGARLQETIAQIRGVRGPNVRIVVLGSTPAMHFWTTRCLARARLHGDDETRCYSGATTNAGAARASDDLLKQVARQNPGVTFVSLWDRLCQGSNCATVQDGVILLRDHNHFTVEGADKILSSALNDAAMASPTTADQPPRSTSGS